MKSRKIEGSVIGRIFLDHLLETLNEKKVSQVRRTRLLASLKVGKMEDLTIHQAKLVLMQVEIWGKMEEAM